MDEKRLAGVVLPLFSLRRNNDHGIGDLTALRQWIDWAADAHVGFLQLLPVNALGRDECPSPYSAISSVALEPLYLSLEPWTIPGLEERVFNETGDTLPWEQPSGPDLVDYPKVRFWKMWILRGAWNNFKTKPEYECIMPKFREWVKEQGSWLEDFVCFQILCDLFGTEIWWHWPEQDPARAKAIASDYEEEKDFARWLQWLCEKQWEFIRIYADERNVKLMGDIPIGVSLSSADVFFERHLFDTEWCGGAPAEGSYAEDPFTVKWGQNWGIPLYRWDVMAQDNFAWWRRRVKYCTKIFSMYRIDHILGFYRIYSFPWKPTENGVFLPLSTDQAAQRTGGRLPGFKPRGDDNAADRNMNLADGDLYLRLLKWFADFSGMQPETCLSYWNQEIKTAMYNALFRSRSRYAAILWPALFGINKRLNIPGTTGGTNWRERMPFKAVEACGMPQTAWLRTVIDESGRTPLQGEDAIRALKESSKRLFPKITVNNERFLKRMLMWPNGKTL